MIARLVKVNFSFNQIVLVLKIKLLDWKTAKGIFYQLAKQLT